LSKRFISNIVPRISEELWPSGTRAGFWSWSRRFKSRRMPLDRRVITFSKLFTCIYSGLAFQTLCMQSRLYMLEENREVPRWRPKASSERKDDHKIIIIIIIIIIILIIITWRRIAGDVPCGLSI